MFYSLGGVLIITLLLLVVIALVGRALLGD